MQKCYVSILHYWCAKLKNVCAKIDEVVCEIENEIKSREYHSGNSGRYTPVMLILHTNCVGLARNTFAKCYVLM